MPTRRDHDGAPGRLFPPTIVGTGWSLSAQADSGGYGCKPRERLTYLEDYESVEVAIVGPFHERVDATTLGIPAEILAKFSPRDGRDTPIGRNVTLPELEVLKELAIDWSNRPNAGIPRGIFGWAGRKVFHGTSREHAEEIETGGIEMDKSEGGYFGEGFYVADDFELAKSNYADFSDGDEPGSILIFEILESSRILDLRNEEDSVVWRESGLESEMGRPGFAALAARKGIQGVYDRSVGGLAIFDARVFDGVFGRHDLAPRAPASSPSP